MPLKTIKYQGKTYPSWTALWRAHAPEGLQYSAFLYRVRNGYSIEKALEKSHKNERSIEYRGEIFSTLGDLVENKSPDGISEALVRSRLRKGMTLEKALLTSKEELVNVDHSNYVLVKVSGVVYKSLSALAKAKDLDYQTLTKRYKAGYRGNELVTGRKLAQISPKASPVECNGIHFESISALARAHNLPPETVRKRLKRGLSPEKAVSKQRCGPEKSGIKFQGKSYKSRKALAKAFNVPFGTFRNRIYKKWTLAEALNVKKREPRVRHGRCMPPSPQVCEGKHFRSISALARAYNKYHSLVGGRLKLGWTPEQAVGVEPPPEKSIGTEIKVGELTFASHREAARHFKVDETLFNARMSQRGWTAEEAAELIPRTEPVIIGSQSFLSRNEAATAFGIDPVLVKGRMKLGWSLEEALEIVPRATPAYGGYSESFFEQHPEKKDDPATLYFIEVTHRETGESFQKIGITTSSLKHRFRTTKYDATEIAIASISLHAAYQWETLLLEEFQEFQYIPEDVNFAGRTECFHLTDELVDYCSGLVNSLNTETET